MKTPSLLYARACCELSKAEGLRNGVIPRDSPRGPLALEAGHPGAHAVVGSEALPAAPAIDAPGRACCQTAHCSCCPSCKSLAPIRMADRTKGWTVSTPSRLVAHAVPALRAMGVARGSSSPAPQWDGRLGDRPKARWERSRLHPSLTAFRAFFKCPLPRDSCLVLGTRVQQDRQVKVDLRRKRVRRTTGQSPAAPGPASPFRGERSPQEKENPRAPGSPRR